MTNSSPCQATLRRKRARRAEPLIEPILFGAAYSVYVRAARLTLAEKGISYRRVEVDVFSPGGPPPEFLTRQPFGKIPAFEHDGFRLYETGAITRYVDEAFVGPALQPVAPQARARMNQAISVVDNHVYPTLVWALYVERVDAPLQGREADETRIAEALPRAATCLTALAEIMGEGPWLAGPALTLADLHAAPMFDLFLRTPGGREMITHHPALQAWWAAVQLRPAFAETAA